MQRNTRIILLVIAGVLVAGILGIFILFVIFANLIATPSRDIAANFPHDTVVARVGRSRVIE